MPRYDLTAIESGMVLGTRANSRSDALVKFGQILGVRLTDENATSNPSYLMDERLDNFSVVTLAIPIRVRQSTSA